MGDHTTGNDKVTQSATTAASMDTMPETARKRPEPQAAPGVRGFRQDAQKRQPVTEQRPQHPSAPVADAKRWKTLLHS